jgi:RNA polymerase sigma factor (sigma-70 family)
MSSPGTVTRWLADLQAGEREAVQKLWEGYYRRLLAVARKKLGALPRRAEDSEDVALSAFDSFIRGAEQGRFPRLEDRDDLWQLLVVLTSRKAIDRLVHEGRGKRDYRRVQAEDDGALLRGLLGREPDPAFAAEVADECRRLLALLPDDELRLIAVRKMEGWTNREISGQLGLAEATIERRLALIRKAWSHAG